MKDGDTLRNEIAEMKPGTDTRSSVLRNGKEQTFTVRFGELQAQRADAEDRSGAAEGGGAGLSIEPLTRDTARELGVKATGGLVVTGVDRAAVRPTRDFAKATSSKKWTGRSRDRRRAGSALAKPAKGPALAGPPWKSAAFFFFFFFFFCAPRSVTYC